MSPTARPTKKARDTQQRILEVARELFNEQGTAPVSTNHIAAAAGLSPGNLYYHFADKQEIVRALYAQYAAGYDDIWRAGGDGPGVGQLYGNVLLGMELVRRYQFLERELLALRRGDAELSRVYREVYERRLGEWRGFGEALVAQGLLRAPKAPRTLDDLSVAVWLVAEGWLPFLDSLGEPLDDEQARRGIDLVLTVLEPYLTAKGRRAFAGAADATTPGGDR